MSWKIEQVFMVYQVVKMRASILQIFDNKLLIWRLVFTSFLVYRNLVKVIPVNPGFCGKDSTDKC